MNQGLLTSPFPTIRSTTNFFNDPMGIIHRSSFDSLSTVKDYNEIIGPYEKQLDLSCGLKFVEFTCSSVDEAKKRAIVIAMHTFNTKHMSFIRVFSKSSLANGVFLKNLLNLWMQFGVAEAEEKMNLLVGKGHITTADIQTIKDKQKR